MSGSQMKKSVEDLLRVPAPELKDHLLRAFEEIRKYGIGNLLGDYPDFMSHLLKQLKQADPARLLSEIPHAAAPLADTLWEGVAFLAGRSKTMQSILKEVERDFCCNIEASDSPFQSHFVTERGNIHGGAGLVHFKNEDFRFMGPTELLMDLLTGDLFMGFGNLRLQTAGHPGWAKRIAPVMGEIGRLLKGA